MTVAGLFRSLALALIVVGGAGACFSTPHGPVPPEVLTELVRAYEEAANEHQIQRATSMFTEQAEWTIDGVLFCKGLREIGALLEYERAVGARRRYENIQVFGTTVRADVVGHNDLLAALSLGEVENTVVFDFEGGLILSLRTHSPPEEAAARQEVLMKFFDRVWRDHPDEAHQLLDRGGGLLNPDNARRLVEIARQG